MVHQLFHQRRRLVLVSVDWRLFWLSLSPKVDMRPLSFHHCYHATGVPVLVPHGIASGLLELIQQWVHWAFLCSHQTIRHFRQCVCRTGVTQNSRKTDIWIDFEKFGLEPSSNTEDIQHQDLVHLNSCTALSNVCVAEEEHDCLPLRVSNVGPTVTLY